MSLLWNWIVRLRFVVFVAWSIGTGTAIAQQLSCAEDKRTDALVCFAPSQLKESGGIRTAPFYMGGPNGVRRTPYTVAVNCSNGVMHLKDRDGVSFGGSSLTDGTTHSRLLWRYICEEKIPQPKKKKG